MKLAFQVMNNLLSNSLISNLSNSKSLAAYEKDILLSCWSILPDIVECIVSIVSRRSNESVSEDEVPSSDGFEFVSAGDILTKDDFELLLRIIHFSFCVFISLFPSINCDSEDFRNSLDPLLQKTFDLLTTLLTKSFKLYYNKQTEKYKYPLGFLIKICSLRFPLCIEQYLMKQLDHMVSAALKEAGEVNF